MVQVEIAVQRWLGYSDTNLSPGTWGEPWKVYFTVLGYVGKSVVGTVPFPLHRDSLLLHVHCMRPSLCVREFTVTVTV
jgi:hypothetical protein